MTSVEFAEAARTIAQIVRRSGALAPSFRSPPRVKGALRSIRRGRNGAVTVSVSIKGRPAPAVLADMIDGAIASNEVSGIEASLLRDAMWYGVAHLAVPAPTPVIDLRDQLAA